jgi:hypothetical protein
MGINVMPLARKFLASHLSLPCALMISLAQTTPSGDTPLPLRAALVLTPEFCATQARSLLSWKKVAIGNIACSKLETGLKGVFSSLTSVTHPSSSGEAQVVLLPRFVQTITEKGIAVTILEWNVKDTSGRTVWIEMAPGSGHDKKGDQTAVAGTAVEAAIELSAREMAAAPELRKLTQLAQQPQSVSETDAQSAPAALPGALPPNAGAGSDPNRYTLEYIHSDRQWQANLRKTSYDSISGWFQDSIAAEMERKGFHRGASSEQVCCKLTLEILDVKTVNNSLLAHMDPLSTKGPGIDVTVNLKLADGSGNLVYTKEYQGEKLVEVVPGIPTAEKVSTLLREAISNMVSDDFSFDLSFDTALTAAINAGAK